MFWIPQRLYNALPVFYLLAALSILLIPTDGFIIIITEGMITIFAIWLIGYSAWIIFKRFRWTRSGTIY